MTADHDIVQEVKKGNVAAFSQLVMRHQKVLMRLALRMTRDLELAEDIVQDSFIKAYRKIGLFEGRSSFKSWVYQITLNTAKNKLRSRKRETVDISKISIAVDATADKRLVHEDIQEIIQREVEQLPDKQRTALNLRIFEDLSFKEIAEIMDCPYDTAKANYRHGLMKLRHRFQESMALKGWENYQKNVLTHIKRRIMEVDA